MSDFRAGVCETHRPHVVWDASYEPFGKATITAQPYFENPLRRPGQYEDKETGIYQNHFRDLDPETGRYYQSDPIGLAGGLSTFSYVGGNPLSRIDPYGLETVVQSHAVSGDNYHTLIRITPCNQQKWMADPRFQLKDEKGRHFLTLGAGPVLGSLVSDLNRTKDRESHSAGDPLCGCAEEDAVIEKLLRLDAAYKDDLDYDLFPANRDSASWWLPDDGYNSNSYVSGLIDAAKLPKPTLFLNTPGWQKPVPPGAFKP